MFNLVKESSSKIIKILGTFRIGAPSNLYHQKPVEHNNLRRKIPKSRSFTAWAKILVLLQLRVRGKEGPCVQKVPVVSTADLILAKMPSSRYHN